MKKKSIDKNSLKKPLFARKRSEIVTHLNIDIMCNSNPLEKSKSREALMNSNSVSFLLNSRGKMNSRGSSIDKNETRASGSKKCLSRLKDDLKKNKI
jgi:hypothetical protein